MATLELPVRNDFDAYDFQIDLEDAVYTLKFAFNVRLNLWVMAIADSVGEEIVAGIPIFTNLVLNQQFVSDQLPPGAFVALDESGEDKDAERDDLGNDVKIIYEESA